MNQIVIVFVPTGATQREFELALRDLSEPFETNKPEPSKAEEATITDNDRLPLWTWFIPNPSP